MPRGRKRKEAPAAPAPWPAHANGTLKMFGQMTRTQRLEQTRASLERVGIRVHEAAQDEGSVMPLDALDAHDDEAAI